jgi:hypothetical protein
MAILLEIVLPNQYDIVFTGSEKLLIGIGVTTLAWVVATFAYDPNRINTTGEVLDQDAPSTHAAKLIHFVELIKPYPMGWRKFLLANNRPDLIEKCEGGFSRSILQMVLGTLAIYCLLFGLGSWLYGNSLEAIITLILGCISGWIVLKRL